MMKSFRLMRYVEGVLVEKSTINTSSKREAVSFTKRVARQEPDAIIVLEGYRSPLDDGEGWEIVQAFKRTQRGGARAV